MTAEQTAEYLLSKNRSFERNILYDIDKNGQRFCELIIQNKTHPAFPITVTVTDTGCSLSVGKFENVTGSSRMTADQALSAIDDIMLDKIIFVLGYNEEDDVGFGSPFFSHIFALTGGEDDMGADYGKFIKKISTPIKKNLRFLYFLKGRFFVFNYSGSVKNTIIR